MVSDRTDAGKQLAHALRRYRGADAVVYAIPRGGVVVGYEIARALHLPLDIAVSRKIGHPHNLECAIGAVNERGVTLFSDVEMGAVDPVWLAEETERQRKEAQRRVSIYRGKKRAIPAAGKTAIIVDDGIATGLTIRLAIAAIRKDHPARLVVAVPVSPADSAQRLKHEVDELIVLEPPQDFLGAVGAHYEKFDQVEDDEVVRLMKKTSSRHSK